MLYHALEKHCRCYLFLEEDFILFFLFSLFCKHYYFPILQAYEMRNAGAVIHSHGMESCLVTMINPSAKEFRVWILTFLLILECGYILIKSLSVFAAFFFQWQITHMEMIKGIQGHGYYDELVVPIIENTAHERELTESLAEAVCFLLSVARSHFLLLAWEYYINFFHWSFHWGV